LTAGRRTIEPASGVDLDDVQGLVVRGYRMPLARHLGLRVEDSPAAPGFLGALVDGSAGVPQLTTATPWEVKPEVCVNLGLTATGLAALGVPDSSLATFAAEFRQGAAARAEEIGDTGPSAADHWLPWLRHDGPHILVSLFGQTVEAVGFATAALATRWMPGCTETGRADGQALPNNAAHFGYRDGFSQPTIEGLPLAGLPDRLPRPPVGEFLLGYPSQHPGFTYPMPIPAELGRNGSYAAFRVLAQDVDGFAEFLREQSVRTGLPEELIAAKLCGRWRNGTPLALSPDTDTPDPPIAAEAMNDFDYVGSYGDERGLRCPVGSHARRMYPRGSRVAGGGGHLHRIVRRGITYGPTYDPANPRDGHERGLLGLFIGVSLRDQFEFLMRDWANDGRFAAGLGRSNDPLIGSQTHSDGRFTIPIPTGHVVLDGLSRFVTTRGGAYCFLPSVTAMRHLAALDIPTQRPARHARTTSADG
jgi:deferrochelatase/peroxidase EfeB